MNLNDRENLRNRTINNTGNNIINQLPILNNNLNGSGNSNLSNQQNQYGNNFNYRLDEYGNNFNNLNNNRKPSRQKLDSRENYNLNNNNNLGNLTPSTSTSPLDNSYIHQELSNTKRILKNILENQNELQSKIIDYNKIISEQENIIRLNNIKLNEHDSKLTEILITFNNYLQLNDKSTKIINDLTHRSEDSIKKSEFSELKSNFYNFNRSNENKIFEITNKLEEINQKSTETQKEQEVFHKYTLEKLKVYQNDSMETRIQQQQQLIKFEESRETKINQQFEQMKSLIKIVEKNLNNESIYRKNMIENIQEEIMQVLIKKDERLLNLEKMQLESEKKFINFNKDYIVTFQDLINKHIEKYDIEIKSIKSLFTNEIMKIDSKINENFDNLKNEIYEVKVNYNEYQNTFSQFESIFKENFESINNKYEIFEKDLNLLKIDTKSISETLSKFMKENLFTIENKLENGINILDIKLNKKIIDLHSNFEIQNNKVDKHFVDVNDKIENSNKTIAELIFFKKYFFEKSKTYEKNGVSSGTELVILESRIEEKLEKLKNELQEYEKKLIFIMNMHIDTMKKNIDKEQNKIVNEISDKLETKINVLKRELDEIKIEEDLIKEGRVQEYIIESEDRIKKVNEIKFKKLQDDVENLNLKIFNQVMNIN